MSEPVLSDTRFHSEEAAYAFIEAKLWPNGPVCPHCKVVGRAYRLKGAATRIGLLKCSACRKQFNVKVGTIFEGSHIPLRKWLQAFHLMCSSKNLFESAYCAGARTGIGLSSASMPERMQAQ